MYSDSPLAGAPIASIYTLTTPSIDLVASLVANATATAALTTAITMAAALQASATVRAKSITVKPRGNTKGNNGNGSTFLDLPLPSSITTGDMLLAAVTVVGGDGITITEPAGWTLLSRVDSGTDLAQAIYYRLAVEGDASTVPRWTFNTSNKASGVVNAFYDTSATAPAASVGQANVSSTTIAAPSADNTHEFAEAVWFFGTKAATTQTGLPSGSTFGGQDSSAGGSATTTISAYKDIPAAGTVASASATTADAAVNIGHLILLDTRNDISALILESSASIVANLTTQIPLTSSIAGSASVSGELTTAIALAALANAVGDIIADLSTQIAAESSIGAVASINAELTTAIELQAMLAGEASISATLAEYALIESHLSAEASVTASLTTAIALAAALSSGAEIAASMQTAVALRTIIRARAILEATLLDNSSRRATILADGYTVVVGADDYTAIVSYERDQIDTE